MPYTREKKLINLNSNNATIFNNSTYLSNLTFAFRSIISRNDQIDHLEGGIESCQIPISFYVVNYSNNKLSFSILDGGTFLTYTLYISVGNYDAETLFTEMQTQFTALGMSFTLSINEINGKITITYNSTGGKIFYSINHSNSTCFKLLGFDDKTDYYPTVNVLLGVYPLNLLGIKRINIYVDQFCTSNVDSSGYGTTNLTQSISVSEPPFGMINYVNVDTNYSILRTFEINTLDVRITDEYGNFINFNGVDWSMTLCLYIYRNTVQSYRPLQLHEFMMKNKLVESQLEEQDLPNVEEEGKEEKTVDVQNEEETVNIPIEENPQENDELNFLVE